MVVKDVEMLDSTLPTWSEMISREVRRIAAVMPESTDVTALSRAFPHAEIISMTEDGLLPESPPQDFDVLFVSSVLMGAKKPAVLFKSVQARCKFVIAQSVIRGMRLPAANQELAGDGDYMRYCFGADEPARIPQAFDLSKLGKRVIAFVPYDANPGSRHFLLLLRGNLPLQTKEFYDGSDEDRPSPQQASSGSAPVQDAGDSDQPAGVVR